MGEGWRLFNDESIWGGRNGFWRMKCGAYVSPNEAQTISEEV